MEDRQYRSGRQETYQVQQPPDTITRLCAHTKPVLGPGPVERDLLVCAGVAGFLVGEVGRLLRDGVVRSDNFEGFGVAGGAAHVGISLGPRIVRYGSLSMNSAIVRCMRSNLGVQCVGNTQRKKASREEGEGKIKLTGPAQQSRCKSAGACCRSGRDGYGRPS